MKKLVLASVSAVALLGLAACTDTDDTTTQSTNPPAETATPGATPPATDDTTTQAITPSPESGTGGDMQSSEPEAEPIDPAPAQPAPAQ